MDSALCEMRSHRCVGVVPRTRPTVSPTRLKQGLVLCQNVLHRGLSNVEDERFQVIEMEVICFDTTKYDISPLDRLAVAELGAEPDLLAFAENLVRNQNVVVDGGLHVGRAA